MRRKILPFILGGALSIAAVAPAAADMHGTTCTVVDESTGGGAAALASLIGIAADVSVGANVCDVTVEVLNNSLNNLLRNANIEVLNNSLNNLLRNADIIDDVNVLNDSQIQVNLLSGPSFILDLT